MQTTNEIQPPVSSVLLDLRRVPLAELPAMGSGALSGTVQRALPESLTVLPESLAAPVSVAAFNSAI